MEEKKTEKYLPVLQNFVKTMNLRINTTTGLPPESVKNENFLQVLYNSQKPVKKRKPKFKKGDKVRLAFDNYSFRKGYKSQYTDEIFRVTRIATFRPIPTYFLENIQSGEQMKGKYYEEEMQRVIKK